MSATIPEPVESTARPVRARLPPDSLLIAEFEYVAQAAFQANEDRARVSTFYILSLGTLVAGILSSQAANSAQPATYWAFAVLFLLLSIFGAATVLQLVRLRQAWFDSVRAMNQLKEYYVRHSAEADLEQAFRWQAATLPRVYKVWSLSFLLALQVAMVGGLTFGACMQFTGLYFHTWDLPVAAVSGLAFAAGQMLLYRRLLAE